MKNANEIANITAAATMALVAKRKEKAINILENSIAPQIEQAAEKCECYINYHVDANVDINVIIEELENLGYEVKKKGYSLNISWMQLYLAAVVSENKA
jgi:hypothetical protein